MVQIVLYKNPTERNRVYKSPYLGNGPRSVMGVFRDPVDVMNPVVDVSYQQFDYVIKTDGEQVIDSSKNMILYGDAKITVSMHEYNYAYIPVFGRYYFISRVTIVRSNLFRYEMHVDPLMSFRQEILALSPVISRYEHSTNFYLPDPIAKLSARTSYMRINSSGNNPFSISQSNWTFMLSAMISWDVPGGMLVRPTSRMFANNAKVVMNYGDVEDMVKSLNTPDFKTAMENLFANAPLDSILSLRLYPCNLYEFLGIDTSDTPDAVVIGSYNTGAKGYLVPTLVDAPNSCSKWLPAFHVAAATSNWQWCQYNDDVQIWLPFIGFVTIAPEQFYGKHVYPKYTIDFETGTVFVNLYSSTSTTVSGVNENEIVYTGSAKIGVDVPVSQGSATEQLRNSLLGGMTALLSIAAAPASGGLSLAGLGSSIAGQLNNMVPRYSHGGNGGGPFNNWFSELDPFALVGARRPIYADNYAATFGYPYYESAQLSTLSGFVQVEEVHLEGFDRALTPEMEEIEQALKSGVIL